VQVPARDLVLVLAMVIVAGIKHTLPSVMSVFPPSLVTWVLIKYFFVIVVAVPRLRLRSRIM
jgi:hypothetical protein